MRKKETGHRSAGGLLIGLLLVVATSNAQTPLLDYGVAVGVGASDNITRVPEGKVEDQLVAIGGGIAFERATRRLTAFALGNLSFLTYVDNTFDDELIGNLAGDFTFFFVPERFSWVLQDNFGQVRRVATDPTTPDNRQNVNFVTTGPDITLPLGQRSGIQVGARYSDAYYEDSGFDFDEISGSASIFRAISHASRVSLNGNAARTRYEDAEEVDYDEYELFASYEAEHLRTTLLLDAGYAKLKFDDFDGTDGYLVRGTLRRRLGPSSIISIHGGREFSNAAHELRLVHEIEGSGGLGTQPIQSVPNPFESTYGALRWDFVGRRTQFGLGVSYYDEDYELSDAFDRDRFVYSALLSRDFRRNLRGRVEATVAKERYDDPDREFTEADATLALEWQFGARMYVSLQYRWVDREDDVAADEFTENQLWLLFGYSRNGSGRIGAVELPTIGEGGR